MRRNRQLLLFVFVLLCVSTSPIYAQDTLPAPLPPNASPAASVSLKPYTFTPDTVWVASALSEQFLGRGTNEIIGADHTLTPVLEHLRLLKAGVSTDTLRIVHIGDSHVRGKIFPNAAGEKMAAAFGAVSYTGMGVNGATCLTFTHAARINAIAELNPALLILSFGTNESHNKRYNSTVHYGQIDELVKLLRSKLPHTPILLTTPPGSYESFRARNRRRTYAINPRTTIAVDIIRRYGEAHKLPVWDMYNLVGGKEYACKNWTAAKLMRPDHVHYLPEAYALQGELLYEAIINAYNVYVTH